VSEETVYRTYHSVYINNLGVYNAYCTCMWFPDFFWSLAYHTLQFGRDKELEIIRNVSKCYSYTTVTRLFLTISAVRNVSTSFSRHFSATKGYITLSATGSKDSNDDMESTSSRSGSPHRSLSIYTESNPSSYYEHSTLASFSQSALASDGLRKDMLRTRSHASRTQAVLVVGPPGYIILSLFYYPKV